MTPELETCLNYCDHGEGSASAPLTPYLPTLRGLIINAVKAEVASLRASLEKAEAALCRARSATAVMKSKCLYCHGTNTGWDGKRCVVCDNMDAALSSTAPCQHESRVRQLEEERVFYRACLSEIRRGRGAYAPDPFEHARNVIDGNKEIARRAIEEDHGANDAGEPCACDLCAEIFR